MSCFLSLPLLMVELNLLSPPTDNPPTEFKWMQLLFERIWFQRSEQNYQSHQWRKFSMSRSDKAAPGGHTATGVKWGCSSIEVVLHYFAIFWICSMQWQPLQGSLKHNIHIYFIMSTLLVSSSWQEKNESINMNSFFDSNTKVVLYSLTKTTDQCPAAFDKVNIKTPPKMLRIFGSLNDPNIYLNALCIEM